MKKILFISCLLIVSIFNICAISSDDEVGISGKDTIVNNCNAPFSQAEIMIIANIRVYDVDNNDITKDLVLVKDNWGPNKTVPGLFKQTYQINYALKEHTYVLNIFNVDIPLNEDKPLEEEIGVLELYSKDEYTFNEIVNLIEQKEFVVISQYFILQDNYSANKDKPGTYRIKIRAIVNSNEVSYLYDINVIEGSSTKSIMPLIITIILIAVIVIASVITFFIIRRRRIWKELKFYWQY